MQFEIPFAERLVPVPPPFVLPEVGEQADAPIPWLLRNLKSSVDMGPLNTPAEWLYMMGYKAAELEHLIPAVEAEGILDPITIMPPEYDGGYVMGNGHHRLVLAILRGDDTIPVILWEDSLSAPESSTHSGREYGAEADFKLAAMLHDSLSEAASDAGYENEDSCDCEDCNPAMAA